MRYGQEAEVLAWGMVFIFQPVSCVVYPVSVLPGSLQVVAHIIAAIVWFHYIYDVVKEKGILVRVGE